MVRAVNNDDGFDFWLGLPSYDPMGMIYTEAIYRELVDSHQD
jgi:hypothetical protein